MLGEDLSGGAIFDGMGTAATNLETSFNDAVSGPGAFLTVPKVGMPADGTRTIEPGSDQDMKGSFGLSGDNWTVAGSWGARPSNTGKTGEGGSGRNRTGATPGIAGSVFSGGPGGGGSYFGSGFEGQDYGGAGGPNAAGGDWAACGGAGNPGGGNSFGKKKIKEALDESLRRLKTDYIDLYKLHWPERNTNYFGDLDYAGEDLLDITIQLRYDWATYDVGPATRALANIR